MELGNLVPSNSLPVKCQKECNPNAFVLLSMMIFIALISCNQLINKFLTVEKFYLDCI